MFQLFWTRSCNLVETETLDLHAKSQGKSLNRVVMGALPRGKHVKPLVSEFGDYVNLVVHPQSHTIEQEFLSKLPRGATVQSRHLQTWGILRVALDKQVKKRTLADKLGKLKQQLDLNNFLTRNNFKIMCNFSTSWGVSTTPTSSLR